MKMLELEARRQTLPFLQYQLPNNHHASIIHQAMKPTSPINTVEEHTNIIVQSMKNKR